MKSQKTTVGRSSRTPAKHNLLNKTVGRIAGAVKWIPQRPLGYRTIDLCAGDGHHAEGYDFWNGSSPGILIKHAKTVAHQGMNNVNVDLYEINRNTFDSLVGNLIEHIGVPHYAGAGRADFTIQSDPRLPTVAVRAILGSGRNADIAGIRRNDCVFVNNDPNTIHDWAMRPGFIQEIQARTRLCTTFSTMGCNVGGLMMKDSAERAQWYEHLEVIRGRLPDNHDLMLAAIERDASKWAYLLSVPSVWMDKTETETRKSFDEIGRNMRIAWLRRSPADFTDMTDALFLRKSERQKLTNQEQNQ
jgi:hypothetical protein